MTKPAEHLPLTHHVAQSPPILSVPYEPRPAKLRDRTAVIGIIGLG